MNAKHKRLVKPLTTLAVVASVSVCLVPALATLLGKISGRLGEFRLSWILFAFALTLVYWPVNAYVWNMVLKAMGHALPAGTAIRIWLTTQTCRWLPGGVWHYGSRTLHAVSHGIPSTVAVASMALEMLLTIAAWAVICLPGLAYYGNHALRVDGIFSTRMIAIIAVGGLLLVLMGSAVFLPWWGLPERRRAMLERFASLRMARPRAIPSLACLAAYVALSLVNGVAFYAVIGAVAPDHHVPFLAALSANAIAWIAGLFAVMAPGGLVVREATLVLQLSLWMPAPVAVVVAVLWRLVQLSVELVCVAVAIAPQFVASRFARPATGPAAAESLATQPMPSKQTNNHEAASETWNEKPTHRPLSTAARI
ncbi:MAG: flippase-like domain-containing protein [Planctomycetia bacterium]|nr:flippase-like domain-containing protein [Planctomycetia bacterium]